MNTSGVDSLFDINDLRSELVELRSALTSEQDRFVSGMEAGVDYSGETYLTLRSPTLNRFLRLKSYLRQLKEGVDVSWKRHVCLRIVESSMTPYAVRDEDGELMGHYSVDSSSAMKALDLLCKIDGNYKDQGENDSDLANQISTIQRRLTALNAPKTYSSEETTIASFEVINDDDDD